MRIVVFGASRGVGRCLVERALGEGHHVTAVARNPSALHVPHARLRAVRCDVLDAPSVRAAIAGHDVVFGTLGADTRGPTSLYSAGARSILQGMKSHGIRRLIFLSNFGVLGEQGSSVREKVLLLLARLMIRDTLADHRRALREILEHAPEWVAVRALPLTDNAGLGRYRIALDGLPVRGTRIARADVADFMLRQATDDSYLGKAPAIAY